MTLTYYGAHIRLIINNNPSLQCDSLDIYTTINSNIGNQTLKYPIGLISADEIVLSGMPWWQNGTNTNNYLYTNQSYWTMSPSFWDSAAYVFHVNSSGSLDESFGSVYREHGVRPVINLRSDTVLSGSGTSTDPFKVVGA